MTASRVGLAVSLAVISWACGPVQGREAAQASTIRLHGLVYTLPEGWSLRMTGGVTQIIKGKDTSRQAQHHPPRLIRADVKSPRAWLEWNSDALKPILQRNYKLAQEPSFKWTELGSNAFYGYQHARPGRPTYWSGYILAGRKVLQVKLTLAEDPRSDEVSQELLSILGNVREASDSETGNEWPNQEQMVVDGFENPNMNDLGDKNDQGDYFGKPPTSEQKT